MNDATERLIGCAFTNRKAAEQVLSLPRIMFGDETEPHRLIVDVLDEQYRALKEEFGLTRNTFRTMLEMKQVGSPAFRVSCVAAFNFCMIKAAKPSEVPALMKQVTAETNRLRGYELLEAEKYDEAIPLLRDGLVNEKKIQRLIEAVRKKKEKPPEETAEVEQPSIYGTLSLRGDKVPQPIIRVASYLAAELEEPLDVRHLAAAIWCFGAAIGKSAVLRNRGQKYYPNLFIVALGASGQNKTGLVTQVGDLLNGAGVGHSSGLAAATMEAFIAACGATIKDGDTSKVNQAIAAHSMDQWGRAFVIDEFRALIKQLIPDEQVIRCGQLFCRLTDNTNVEMRTITNGIRVIGDCCINLFGCSQADPWNEEIRTATFQTSGVAGRIVPVNAERIKLAIDPIPTDQATAMAELRKVRDAAESWANAVKIPVLMENDALTKAKSLFREQKYVQEYCRDQQVDFEILESKILVQAAKVAMIFGFVNAAQKETMDQIVVTLSDLSFPFSFIGGAHITNDMHEIAMTEEGRLMDRIVKVIRRKRGATGREICRSISEPSFVVERLLGTLERDGEVKRRLDGRRVVFEVSGVRRKEPQK